MKPHLSRVFVLGACLAFAPRFVAFAQTPLTTQNTMPTISPEHPERLRDSILAAFKAGQRKVVVPPGVYQIPPSNTGANLEFSDLKDFEIDASGATFLMLDNSKGGVAFRNCQNVTLRGATIRNATFPFTQGRIVAIAPDRKSFELQIDAGYPATLDDPQSFNARTTYYLFDRITRRLSHTMNDSSRILPVLRGNYPDPATPQRAKTPRTKSLTRR